MLRPIASAVLLATLAVACRRGAEPSQGRAEMQASGAPSASAPSGSPESASPSVDARPEAPDDRIERLVRAKLFGDPELTGGGSIIIFVEGGRVTLEGWVGSATERTLAEADAATVAGVVSVNNRLLVRQSAAAPGGGRR